MVKQVIVMRKDLKMRRGKEIAQGSHASIAFMTKRIGKISGLDDLGPEAWEWINGRFTKVCLQVDSEQELTNVYEAAKAAGLEVNLITDAGATEFHGVPTKTCLAIGPHEADRIDQITQHLKLY